MAKFLIHITTGPADATKSTLGCLIAATALKEGHDVDVFLAGDGVHLFGPSTLPNQEAAGIGKLSEIIASIDEDGGNFYLSGRSSEARGYDASILEGHRAEFAMPTKLVDLASGADTVLCY